MMILVEVGGVEKFLDKHEAALVRSVLPDQWSLDPSDDTRIVDEARAIFEADPNRFVAKNVLRPRTGSGSSFQPPPHTHIHTHLSLFILLYAIYHVPFSHNHLYIRQNSG
jgi:hypothetical protein